jgi:hypothetical protein
MSFGLAYRARRTHQLCALRWGRIKSLAIETKMAVDIVVYIELRASKLVTILFSYPWIGFIDNELLAARASPCSARCRVMPLDKRFLA